MTSGEPTSGTPTGSPTLRVAVAGLLAVALVASLVWLVLELTGRSEDDNPAQKDRDTVMLKAREYMLAAWNFGASDLEGKKLTTYRERVDPLITTSFRTDFDQAVTLLEKAVADNGYSRTATVDRVAVESIEDESAEVIVGGESSETVGKEQRTTPYAWTISLKEVDGTWLVDEFTEYGSDQGADQGAGQGGAQ